MTTNNQNCNTYINSFIFWHNVVNRSKQQLNNNIRCLCNTDINNKQRHSIEFHNPLLIVPWINNTKILDLSDTKWKRCRIPLNCYDCNDTGITTLPKKIEQLNRINFWCKCKETNSTFYLIDSIRCFGYKIYLCKKCKFAVNIN